MRVRRGPRQPDLAHGDAHRSGNLEQPNPQRAALRPSPARAGQTQPPQPVHQDMGERGEVQPELVGPQDCRAGAVGEQIELTPLDAIFHVAPRAVQFFVEPLRSGDLAAQAGHHEARVGPLGQMFRLGHHPTGATPRLARPIAKLPEPPRWLTGVRLAAAGLAQGLVDPLHQLRVARQPQHVVHLVALAPVHDLLPAESRVAPDDDPRLRPRRSISPIRRSTSRSSTPPASDVSRPPSKRPTTARRPKG